MKKVMLLMIAILLSTASFSQKKQAEELLKKVIAKTTSYPGVETDFSFTMQNEEAGINEVKSGKLFFSGEKFRLEFPGQYVISNGKTTWTYIEDDEEVMVNDAQEGANSFNITSLLTSYDDNYKIKYGGEKTVDGKKYEVIEMQPKAENNFKKIDLYIDTKLAQVKQLIVLDKNGSSYTYLIKSFTPLDSINTNLFSFSEKEFPDAEINDMR